MMNAAVFIFAVATAMQSLLLGFSIMQSTSDIS